MIGSPSAYGVLVWYNVSFINWAQQNQTMELTQFNEPSLTSLLRALSFCRNDMTATGETSPPLLMACWQKLSLVSEILARDLVYLSDTFPGYSRNVLCSGRDQEGNGRGVWRKQSSLGRALFKLAWHILRVKGDLKPGKLG